MKITKKQCTAAALYWTRILTGEISSRSLNSSKRELPSFMASLAVDIRRENITKLDESNPKWSSNFNDSLSLLLADADDKSCLNLDYHLEGLLKQAATIAGVPEALFPAGKLSMTFDNHGNIIVGGETINAEDFVYETSDPKTSSLG